MNEAKAMLKIMFRLWTLANRSKERRTVKRNRHQRNTENLEKPPLTREWLDEVIKRGKTLPQIVDKGFVKVGEVRHQGKFVADLCRPWALDKAIKRHKKFMAAK